MWTRRRWLQGSVAAGAAAASWRLWAAPAAARDARLLVVFLRGAYDSLSAVVPYADAFYYEVRPNIAIAPPRADDADASVVLDSRWSLHPRLAEPLMPLWEAGQVAFVPFAGTAFVSRSHFEAQDWIEFGQPPRGRPDPGSGFLNRLLVELGAGRAVAFTRTLPPSLRGERQVANAPLVGAGRKVLDASYEQLVQAMYAGHAYEALVDEGLGLRQQVAQELRTEMQQASREAPPAGSFALEAARLGRLLREQPQYAVGFVDVGGWDTHAGQGAASGALAGRLQGLGQGFDELARALGEREWRRTVVVVMSEFGRTFRENGSRGTDHGHGTTLWVLGGGVRGGIRGEQGAFAPGRLHEDRDAPVLNEYRATLGGLLARTYGLSAASLQKVFPQAKAIDLGLV